ncbi:uncharacterized protein KY384_000302 [Bacidia gigantensis]|uniref:uncharacterized protein n=1 Tax=Bacidia gigantensis TaxID=2732470 RepID=UPI001D0573AE|nr:uncharacterized protein KY384_000302 [Bacidia gigantensis]KAG8526309.1 hypothetical protein KY384_000302 [Bacidia gigantensis]
METLNGLEQNLQIALHEHIADVKAELAQEQKSHDAAFDAERNGYQQDIHALKARVSELEDEKQHNAGRAGEAVSSALLGVRLKEVEAELLLCKEDFRKVNTAKRMLEIRIRKYKAIQKEWRAYYRDWIERQPHRRHSPKKSRRNGESSSKPSLEPKSPRDSAPPTCPPTSSDGGNSSRPTSFHQNARRNVKLGADAGGEEVAFNFAATQTAIHQEEDEVVDELAETFDVTELEAEDAARVGCEDVLVHLEARPEKVEHSEGSSPIVVSERSLKRKKLSNEPEPRIDIHQDRVAHPIAQRKHGVKVELLSSSPLQPSKLVNQRNNAGDSLDLDDVEGTLYTPRKRQRLEQVMRSSTMAWNENLEEQDPTLITGEEIHDEAGPLSVSHKLILPDQDTTSIESETQILEQQLRRARKEAQIAQQNAYNQRVHAKRSLARVNTTDSPKTPRILTTLSGQHRHEDDEFSSGMTTTLGSVTLPWTSHSKHLEGRRTPPSRRDHGAAAVPMLAEDGEGLTSPKVPSGTSKTIKEGKGVTVKVASKDPNRHERLGQLLNDPSPPKNPLISDHNQETKKVMPTATTPGAKASLRTPQTAPAKQSKAIVQPGSEPAQVLASKFRNPKIYLRKSTPNILRSGSIQPDDEPLRARPLQRLKLEDFKPNPAHSSFAFHESLRRHDEKKSRGGCTDPNCQRCKEIDKFLDASGFLSSSTNNPLTTSDNDDKLLKDYLGPSYQRTLSTITPAEKKELLHKARSQQWKDRFGKHRQTFSKAAEPPGFWDTDFPSTQENEELREQARLMERRKVEERREEALRGGLWVFADEVAKATSIVECRELHFGSIVEG